MPGANSHLGAWTGPCAAAGTGPCTITATKNDSVQVTARFDPDVVPRYRLKAVVPLAEANAMRAGKVVGNVDGVAAAYDVDPARLTKLLTTDSSAIAVNRRGDVAGQSEGHPFVAYATSYTAVLQQIDGRAVALHDGGIMLGQAYNPPLTGRPTFTFDGSTTTWLEAKDFWGYSINNFAVIGGCIGTGPSATGALFQNGLLASASPLACAEVLNNTGTAVGTRRWTKSMQRVVVWDGTNLWALTEANDVDDAGMIAGSVDFDGYFAGRTSDTYVFGFHAALYGGGAAQDLNYLADTSSDDRVAHVPMERALAIDAGRILVSFRNGRYGVLEPVTSR